MDIVSFSSDCYCGSSCFRFRLRDLTYHVLVFGLQTREEKSALRAEAARFLDELRAAREPSGTSNTDSPAGVPPQEPSAHDNKNDGVA